MAALACALILSSCSQAKPHAASSTPATSAASTAAPTTSGTASSATPPASPTATAPATFNGTCDDLLPSSRIDVAVGKVTVGKTSFIVGIPEPNIGRLARLDCQYGITTAVVNKKPVSSVKVEIGISLYQTSAQAAARVAGTVQAYRSNGAVPTAATVGQYPATILTGSGEPTLVVAAGPRTVAVTVLHTFVGAGLTTVMPRIADAALNETANFSQGGPVTPSATPSAAGSS